MTRSFSIVLLLPLFVLQAQESSVTREGRYWVKTLRGAGALTQTRMQVRTHGAITVTGNGRAGYSYTLKLRVRAANERQARERLSAIVSAAPRGDLFVLTASPAHADANLASEIRLQLPRTVKEVSVGTSGGGVEVDRKST